MPLNLGIPDPGLLRHATLPSLLKAAFPEVTLNIGSSAESPVDGYLCWGRKPSSRIAEHLALRNGKQLLRCEDAFVRSLQPGNSGPPLGLIIDDQGIYYDAHKPSRLESLTQQELTNEQHERAKDLMVLWRSQRISKYNHKLEAKPPDHPFVLVVDQTMGDYSISCGMADQISFEQMLASAIERHADCLIVLKTHPEVANGTKRGHFRRRHFEHPQVVLDASGGHPTALLEKARAVYVVTSQLGFEALIWGIPVYCFGMPFYAGWGLTHDVMPAPGRRSPCLLEALVHAALVSYAVYLDPFTKSPCSPEVLIKAIGEHRQAFQTDPAWAVAAGFVRWKRKTLQTFLPGTTICNWRWWLKTGRSKDPLLHWGRRMEPLCSWWKGPTYQIEDGFLRSVGLGISQRSPISWIVDYKGIYFDATRPSDLEHWLNNCSLTAQQLNRAKALRQKLVDTGLSKYNLEDIAWNRPSGHQRVVLVVGQVEQDASIRYGGRDVRTNLDLLEKVRSTEASAYVVYKPHPDVVFGGRRASKADRGSAAGYCDEIIYGGAMPQILKQVDAVHTITSLSGFEALLRNVEVYTWGLPFYAGWGLTKDYYKCIRRERIISIECLIYGVLIAYPRYCSRRNGWLITPERAVEELLEWRRSDGAEAYA